MKPNKTNMMKRTLISVLALVACFVGIQAQTQVIAHRGFWKTEGSAQNSITALEKAAEAQLYGSEFDVLMTSDGTIVVNHDNTIEGMAIPETPFKKLKKLKINNGEKLPTLKSITVNKKKFTLDDFSHEHLFYAYDGLMEDIILHLNMARDKYLETRDKAYWWTMIQLLPSSYNQRRTVQLNYQVLKNMYFARKNHKLDCWVHFCEWIETLPYAKELICND